MVGIHMVDTCLIIYVVYSVIIKSNPAPPPCLFLFNNCKRKSKLKLGKPTFCYNNFDYSLLKGSCG